jgi:hypothetical protein
MRAILLATLVVLGSTSCEETELGQVRAAVVINAGDDPSIQAAVDAAAVVAALRFCRKDIRA